MLKRPMYKIPMRKQETTVLIVAGIDLISIIVKFFLAMVTGSLSLLADAWHSISDFATSVMVFLALILDRREADLSNDKSGKPRIIRRSCWEPRVCVVIGLALIAVSATVFKKVYSQSGLEIIKHPGIAAVIILGLMILSYIRYKFEESVGHETDSAALVADANHSKVDLYVLGLVLVSFVSEIIELRIDRWVAAGIALLIFVIAIRTILGSMVQMFKLSKQTDPEQKTIEDRIVLLTGTRFEQVVGTAQSHLINKLKLTDDKQRKKLVSWSVGTAGVFFVVAWLASGVFVVSSREMAIVERFGTPVSMENPVKPGLHYTWPWPIGVVRKVDIQTVQRMRLGYEVQEGSRSGEYILWTNAHYKEEYALLTGDGAIIDFAANMHYKIINPSKFLYSCVDPVATLKMISNQALRDIAGVRPMFELLTVDRDEAENLMLQKVQEDVKQVNLGIQILQICFRDMHPPLEVAPAFEDVVSAQEDLETYIEQALGYRKDLLPIANSDAYSVRSKAQAYKIDQVLKSHGKSSAFIARSAAFSRHLALNKFRIRMETLESWLGNTRLWVVDPKATGGSLSLLVRSGVDSLSDNVSTWSDFDEKGEDRFE